jgi:hypothetical protein
MTTKRIRKAQVIAELKKLSELNTEFDTTIRKGWHYNGTYHRNCWVVNRAYVGPVVLGDTLADAMENIQLRIEESEYLSEQQAKYQAEYQESDHLAFKLSVFDALIVSGEREGEKETVWQVLSYNPSFDGVAYYHEAEYTTDPVRGKELESIFDAKGN